MKISKKSFIELFQGGLIKAITLDQSSKTINTDFLNLVIKNNGEYHHLSISGDECLAGCVLSFKLNNSEIEWDKQ